MDEWTIKTPNPICRLFFKIDLLTEFAALCLTDFIDWRYIHSLVATVFSTQLVNCCPHGRRYYTCVLLPLYLLSDLPPSPPPPSQTKCTVYTDSVCVWGVGANCAVDDILQEFYTLFLTRFRTYQIASPPQTKWPVKTTLRDWCLLSSPVHGIQKAAYDPENCSESWLWFVIWRNRPIAEKQRRKSTQWQRRKAGHIF